MNAWKAAILPLALLPLLLTGCTTDPYRGDRYEERYRLFFAQKVPIEVTPANSNDEIASAFTPADAVRQALTEVEADGYQLASIAPIKWGDGAAIFTFRKQVSPLDRKEQRSPIHYLGVFKGEGNGKPIFYSFYQRKTGYIVSVSGDGPMQSFPVEWIERQLEWKDDGGHHVAQLSPDAQTLYVISESAEGFQVPRERAMVTASRVIDHQKPDSDEERQGRRYLAPLRPQSPRIYDPFPW